MKRFVKMAGVFAGFLALSLAFGAGAVRTVRAQGVVPSPAAEASFVVPVAAQQSGPWSVSLQGTPTVNVAALPAISGNVGIAPGTVLAVTPHLVPFMQSYGDDGNGFSNFTVSTGGKLFVVEQLSAVIVMPNPPPAAIGATLDIHSGIFGFQTINVQPGFPDQSYQGQAFDYSQQIRFYLRDQDVLDIVPAIGTIPAGKKVTLIGYLVDP